MDLAALGADEVETREVFDISKLYCKYRGFASNWSEKWGFSQGECPIIPPVGYVHPADMTR